MTSRTNALVAALALPLVACASLPPPVATPTGEPLAVREETKTAVVTERVKVGEVEHKTNTGETYAKSEVYQDRQRNVQYQVWRSYQGSSPISDDDLYRIAKDKQAEDEATKSRENGVLMNRVGLGLLAAGIAGVVGGYAASQSSSGDGTGMAPGMYVAYGSSVVAGAGGLLTWLGLSKANAEHPLEQDRARAAADRYNRALVGGAAGTTTTTGASLRR